MLLVAFFLLRQSTSHNSCVASQPGAKLIASTTNPESTCLDVTNFHYFFVRLHFFDSYSPHRSPTNVNESALSSFNDHPKMPPISMKPEQNTDDKRITHFCYNAVNPSHGDWVRYWSVGGRSN